METCDIYVQVATGQIATTGLVSLSYVQKVSEKVSLASDFMYNHMAKDVTASFGYDYMLRQCRLRGKIDTNGVVSALLEERLTPGVNFVLSAEVSLQPYLFYTPGYLLLIQCPLFLTRLCKWETKSGTGLLNQKVK
jgi:hypothetical protein